MTSSGRTLPDIISVLFEEQDVCFGRQEFLELEGQLHQISSLVVDLRRVAIVPYRETLSDGARDAQYTKYVFTTSNLPAVSPLR